MPEGLAEAAVTDPNLFGPFRYGRGSNHTFARYLRIGEWTAQYIALRALREMDAFLQRISASFVELQR